MTRERAFSLLELLTVIAIIAIIAGFLFPMATTMREKGNQSTCIGNLQSIGQALKLYRLDERNYPPALYGYLEEGNTEPTTFLYPHYARSRREFKCPDNPNRFDETYMTQPFSVGGNWLNTVPMKRVANRGGAGYTLQDLWYPDPPKRVAYYLFDSYDGGAISPDYREPNHAPMSLRYVEGYQIHYRRDWAEAGILSGGGYPAFMDKELLDRNPEDSTYVTSCWYHSTWHNNVLEPGPRSWTMVLFLDGHTEKRPSTEVGPFMDPQPS